MNKRQIKKNKTEQDLEDFYLAIIKNDVDEVKKSIENKINLNNHNSMNIKYIKSHGYIMVNKSFLYYACEISNLEMIKLMIDNGADYNYIDIEGNNLLHICCGAGKIKCVEYLIKLGVDMNKLNSRNESKIDIAVNKNR
jgi:ankyrin repeat protein